MSPIKENLSTFLLSLILGRFLKSTFFSFPLFFSFQQNQLESYISKYLIHSLLWSLAGDGKLKVREDMGQFIRGITTIPLPPATQMRIIDYEVSFICLFYAFLSFFYHFYPLYIR